MENQEHNDDTLLVTLRVNLVGSLSGKEYIRSRIRLLWCFSNATGLSRNNGKAS